MSTEAHRLKWLVGDDLPRGISICYINAISCINTFPPPVSCFARSFHVSTTSILKIVKTILWHGILCKSCYSCTHSSRQRRDSEDALLGTMLLCSIKQWYMFLSSYCYSAILRMISFISLLLLYSVSLTMLPSECNVLIYKPSHSSSFSLQTLRRAPKSNDQTPAKHQTENTTHQTPSANRRPPHNTKAPKMCKLVTVKWSCGHTSHTETHECEGKGTGGRCEGKWRTTRVTTARHGCEAVRAMAEERRRRDRDRSW